MLFGDVEMTPQSLLLLLHWRSFGYVWNWPIAVNVVRSGRTERHRIVDVTRLGQWGLALILCLALGMFSAYRSSHRSSQ